MKRLAIAALLVAAASGCSSTSTTGASPGASASSTPVPSATSPRPSAMTSATPSPTETSTNAAESLGEAMGAKIAFYAIAKTAGMNESARMDELAGGICSRIESGKPASVGPWMEDAFQLRGDVAAKVAIAAIEFQCPEFKSRVGF